MPHKVDLACVVERHDDYGARVRHIVAVHNSGLAKVDVVGDDVPHPARKAFVMSYNRPSVRDIRKLAHDGLDRSWLHRRRDVNCRSWLRYRSLLSSRCRLNIGHRRGALLCCRGLAGL